MTRNTCKPLFQHSILKIQRLEYNLYILKLHQKKANTKSKRFLHKKRSRHNSCSRSCCFVSFRDFRRDARNATKVKNRVLHATLPLVSVWETIEQLQ